MKTYARIDGGIVRELFETDDDITELFNPALIWIDVTSVVPQPQYGWVYSDGVFSPPADS